MKKLTYQASLSRDLARLKASDDGQKWKFSGYASVFGSVNDRGFSFAKGAFSGVLGEMPKMFFNHDTFGVPIGKWTGLKEDETGLWVEGELSQKVAQASDVHGALVDGLLDGMSVSVQYYAEDLEEREDGSLSLRRVCGMPEISLVTFPSDPGARVAEALSADEVDDAISAIQSVRDLDGFLRDAAKLSRRQAKALVAAAKTALAAELQRDAEDEEQKAVLERLKRAVDQL